MLTLKVGLVLKVLMNERQIQLKKSVERSLGRWEKRSTKCETEKGGMITKIPVRGG